MTSVQAAATYMTALALGLALITPIGAQNVFVVGQGLAVGWPRAGWAVLAAGCCDTLLIAAGAAGASGLLVGVPALRGALLLGGAAFLVYLGVQSWREHTIAVALEDGEAIPVRQVLRRTVAVSLLNPHAVLDTVGVIGAAVAAQPPDSRTLFAGGAMTASWIWFLFLALAAARLRRHLTARTALWFQRFSASVMFVFAALLLREFVLMFS